MVHTPKRLERSDLGLLNVFLLKSVEALRSEQNKQDMFKNWPVIKSPQFLYNPYETW